jgi:hypothetical protein
MGEIRGAQYDNLTESNLVKLGVGKVYGVVVNSHTSGTLKLMDGVDDTAGAQATGILTISGGSITPAKFAESVLTASSNFLDAISASGVLTSDETNPAEDETVTIGSTVYRFRDTLAQAYDVKIGVDADTTLANLVKAINATGTEGVEYFAGTLIHPSVTAGDVTAHATTVTANTAGTAGNAIAKAETSTHLDWDGAGAFLTGGLAPETVTIGAITYRFKDTTAQAYDVKIGATLAISLDNLKLAINGTGVGDGTDYHAGTVAHTLVIATANADTTQKINSRTYGTGNNTLATTETSANASWEDTTLGGGTGASIAGVATAGSTFLINGTSYYFTTILSETLLGSGSAVANEILWVTNDATALDNMKLAINGSGTEGTDYSTGTNANTDVIATTNTATAQTIEAKLFGTLGNSITTTETGANIAWGGATLSGGTDKARLVINTFTFPAGSGVYTFPEPINFVNGLFAVVGGTLDCTVIYN